jgi:DNA-binding GntR family transcriptional regulator
VRIVVVARLLLDDDGSGGALSQPVDERPPELAGREGATAEHEALLQATLDRDADRACGLLSEHYTITYEGLRAAIESSTV